MATDKSTPNASTATENDDDRIELPEPDETGGPVQEVTPRSEYAAYMERKRAEQRGELEPDPDPGDGEEDDGEDGEDEQRGSEEVPAHKRQLGADDEGEFKKADRPPEVETQGKDGEQKPWFAELPEDVRQRIHQQEQYAGDLFQRYSALQGRLAPVQRQNEDLRKENDKLQKQLRDRPATENPTLEDLDSNDAWKEVSEEFPDESGKVRELFSAKESALQEARQQIQQLQDELSQGEEQRKRTEWKRLSVRHPDADTVRSHPAFHQWVQRTLDDQQANPELIRKIQSPFYEDIADVIDAFKADYFGEQPPQPEAPGGQESTHQERPGQPGESQAPARAATPSAQEGQRTPSRQKPPAPAPESQGSGMSGAGRSRAALSPREDYRQLMARKRREHQKR